MAQVTHLFRLVPVPGPWPPLHWAGVGPEPHGWALWSARLPALVHSSHLASSCPGQPFPRLGPRDQRSVSPEPVSPAPLNHAGRRALGTAGEGRMHVAKGRLPC